jgi:hypothetical protein
MSTTVYEKLKFSVALKPASLNGSKLNEESIAPMRLGWRNCAKCNCQEFEGNQNTCANSGCGHSFTDHW